MAGDSRPVLPRRRAPDLGSLAAFTLDAEGRVDSWPVTAERMFGHPPDVVIGQDIREVLMVGPGQREMAAAALAEVRAGRVWNATLAMAFSGGSGPVAIRCEPLAGPASGAVVLAQHASLVIGAGWVRRAADRIGTTLDLPLTAREVVNVAVPAFADAAAIFMAERLLAADETTVRQVGPTAVMRRLAARLVGHPATVTDGLLRPGEVVVFSGDSPSYRAMETNTPVVFDRLDPDTERRLAQRAGGPELTGGLASFLSVPLAARGTVLGCMTFGRSASSPGFGPGDIAAADELVSRAAMSLDNARLYDRERRTAAALKQGMLPGETQVPAGLEAAHRYLPVGASVVGGDWHDLVGLPGGRAAVIIGDAMGHGPESAALMVQLRTAAHTMFELDLPPVEVLRRLDRMAASLPDAPFATCVAAVIDTGGSAVSIVAAGHPPPVLVLPDGSTQVIELPAGLPLGLGEGSLDATKIPLPPGAVLALYTDGLVESRSRSLGEGIELLRTELSATLARPALTLAASCTLVSDSLRQQAEDDVTLVLARIRG